ncbi:MAG: GntG family PLP-dependent aldolase [Actinomycetota bacterium]
MADLRSDTVTTPTGEMRRAMYEAEVGDDVYGEDPTVNRLEEIVAGMLGREAALFVATGTQGNQTCVRVVSRQGTGAVIDAEAHIVNYESGGGAALSGVQFRTLDSERGILDPEAVRSAIRPNAYHLTPTSAVMIENTHNRGGGSIYPLETLQAIRRIAVEAGVKVHADYARVWNAHVATGVALTTYGALCDTMSVCLSKGLAAPVGSLVVGDADVVAEARKIRRLYGGGMRQAGVIAAAGIVAVEGMIERLAEDHARARSLGESLAELLPGSVDLGQVVTNMVQVDTNAMGKTAAEVASALVGDGVLVGQMGPTSLRLVTHKDVDDADVERALAAFRSLANA